MLFPIKCSGQSNKHQFKCLYKIYIFSFLLSFIMNLSFKVNCLIDVYFNNIMPMLLYYFSLRRLVYLLDFLKAYQGPADANYHGF